MKRYIKRPVGIEAMQLTTNNILQVAKWANAIQPEDKKIQISLFPEQLEIPTKEGIMICSIGDYLIKEPFPTDDRMFYPCSADMFELTYMEKQ
jgi:hypothetical protein